MIDLERYPREITLRSGVTLVFRPMDRDDVGRLWDFFQQIPPEDKMFFRQDVSRREVVQHWADTLDYGLVLPILALDGGRVVGGAPLHRPRAGGGEVGAAPRDGRGDRGAVGRGARLREDGIRPRGDVPEFRQRPEGGAPQPGGPPVPDVHGVG